MLYRLIREEDGRVDHGIRQAITDGRNIKPNRGPKVGYAFLLVRDDMTGRQTSLVTKILEETNHSVRFKTLNSTYLLSASNTAH